VFDPQKLKVRFSRILNFGSNVPHLRFSCDHELLVCCVPVIVDKSAAFQDMN